jgi:GT2 family glycosyltransferase
MTTTPSVSLVVLNWNGKEHLQDCLSSLLALDYPQEGLEVILCDNGSTDDSPDFVRDAFPGVKLVCLDHNYGFAEGNNRAAEHATGEWLGFLNNDMHVEPEWLSRMLDVVEDHPDTACVASKILNWNGTAIDFVGGGVNFQGMGYQIDHGARTSQWDRSRRVLFACGGAMLIRSNVFREVGGFEGRYFAYFEDVDLGWRLNVMGYDTWYTPQAKVFHRHHGTSSRIGAHQLKLLYERNALYTIYKNFDDANLAVVLPAALMLLNERALTHSALQQSDWHMDAPAADNERPAADNSGPIGREGVFNKTRRLLRDEGPRVTLDKAVGLVRWKLHLLGERRRRRGLERAGGGGAATKPIPDVSLAAYIAVSEFAHALEWLNASRAAIQARRARTDAEVFALVPDPLTDPSYGEPGYVRFHAWFRRVIGVQERLVPGSSAPQPDGAVPVLINESLTAEG